MKIGKQGVAAPGIPAAGLVLAGGRSRRMGRDKATLIVEGERLLARQLRILGEAGAAELWVSLGADGFTPEQEGLGGKIRVVRDRVSDAGPLEGLGQVLDRTSASRLLVLAVDLPALDAGFLRRMLERSRMGIGVVPVTPGGPEPLCAVYPVGPARATVSGWGGRGEQSPRRLVVDGVAEGWMEEWRLDPADEVGLINWNAPGDWRGFEGASVKGLSSLPTGDRTD